MGLGVVLRNESTSFFVLPKTCAWTFSFFFFFFFFEIKVIWYIFYSLRATDCRAQPMMRETENMGRRLNRFC